MKEVLKMKIQKLLEEEEIHDVDQELLDGLRQYASREVRYIDLPVKERKALNIFFQEVKDVMFQEMLSGEYGASIIVDAIIVLCFEVGYEASQILALDKK